MRKRALTLATTIALLVLSIAPAIATPPESDPGLVDGHKITICHATNSASNPFVLITIDVAAWHTEGEIGHSPDHHVNQETGDHDVVWDEVNGCADDGGGTTST
jgi:hypothetical protein